MLYCSSDDMSFQEFIVRVPATTANLGPAFDCIGMAFDIWNDVVIKSSDRFVLTVEGSGLEDLPKDRTNLVAKAFFSCFNEIGTEAPSVAIHCTNRIPIARGLGSSAAAIVAGLKAANHLSKNQLSTSELLDLAVRMEGHADNVGSALLGGAQIAITDGYSTTTATVDLPKELRAVLFIPSFTISTDKARGILPANIPIADAIFNVGRAALLVNALSSGRLDDLRKATEDKIHQPYREPLFPAAKVIMREALMTEALGAFVSGSGPTIVVLVKEHEMTVAYRIAEAARKTNISGETRIIDITSVGAHIIS